MKKFWAKSRSSYRAFPRLPISNKFSSAFSTGKLETQPDFIFTEWPFGSRTCLLGVGKIWKTGANFDNCRLGLNASDDVRLFLLTNKAKVRSTTSAVQNATADFQRKMMEIYRNRKQKKSRRPRQIRTRCRNDRESQRILRSCGGSAAWKLQG